MKKDYNEPVVEIREYSYAENLVLTASQPGTDTDNSLENDDIYDIFA